MIGKRDMSEVDLVSCLLVFEILLTLVIIAFFSGKN
jgi:hypothetical protein